jgi:uncharacterized membrane protein
MQRRRHGVYVEFDGANYGAAIVAGRLRRVLGYVADCAKVPRGAARDIQLLAVGSEPAWHLTVQGRHVVLTRFGHADLKLSGKPWEQAAGRARYQASSTAWISVRVEEVPCIDVLAETAYGARVELTVSEKEVSQSLTGCAARF